MSKLDAAGAKSLEEILASIRKTLSGGGSDASGGERSAEPMPAPATPEPRAPAAADDDGMLSAKLAGALNEPANGAALDDDLSELLAPDDKRAAPSDIANSAKATKAGGDGKDPLWFLRHPSAAEGKNGAQMPAPNSPPGEGAQVPANEVKLSRPEVLRASLPPLFGAGEERSTTFRPAHAPKTPDSGSVPTAKTQPAPTAPSDGKTAASTEVSARTQPAAPPAPPAEEAANPAPPSTPPAQTESGSSLAAATAAMAREQIPTPEAAPASPAELAPSPQRLPTAKTANASLVEPATDGAPNKAPNGTAEPSTTKPAQPADPAQARTLEQVIGELLEPVIRHWLEANLPRMVEKVVRDEVARALAAEHPAPKT